MFECGALHVHWVGADAQQVACKPTGPSLLAQVLKYGPKPVSNWHGQIRQNSPFEPSVATLGLPSKQHLWATVEGKEHDKAACLLLLPLLCWAAHLVSHPPVASEKAGAQQRCNLPTLRRFGWWESVVMLRKLAIAMLVVFLHVVTDQGLQLLVSQTRDLVQSPALLHRFACHPAPASTLHPRAATHHPVAQPPKRVGNRGARSVSHF